MITSPLQRQSKGKSLTEDDIPFMRHQFMMCYGWISIEDWNNIPIDDTLTMWEFVNQEQRKREELRLCSLKSYGVKNPK